MDSRLKPVRVLLLSEMLVAFFLLAESEGRALGANDQGGADTRAIPKHLYSVVGQASYNGILGGYHSSYNFTLTVSNNWWAMEFVPISGGGMRYIQNSDGSNLVAMTYFQKDRSTAKAWNNGYVLVDRRRTPVSAPEVAHAVFVAFAAQFYLPPGTNGLLCPLWHPDREVNQVPFVISDWQLSASGLPEIIQCRYEANKWNEVLHKPKSTVSSPAGPAGLLAIYSSISQTKFEGEALPSAYAFKAFAPDREDGKDKTSPVYEILVANVVFRGAVESRLFERKFKGIAVVEDYRGGQQQPSTYNITNAAPPRLPL